jgi:hypothetical protein
MVTFWWLCFIFIGIPLFWIAVYLIVKSFNKGGGS